MSIEMIVYESFSELTGTKIDLNGLRDRIRSYSRDSILFHCAALAAGTQLWDGASNHEHNYLLFLKRFFAGPLLGRLLVNYWTSPRKMVLHRQPILLLCKLALKFCRPNGIDIAHQPLEFGLLLLIANDQFHHSLLDGLSVVSTGSDFARVITEFCSMSEYGEEDIARNFVRSQSLLGPLTQDLKNSTNYVDALGEHELETGISREQFLSLVFGVQAYLSSLSLAGIIADPGGLTLTEHRFKDTVIPYQTVSKFLNQVAGNTEFMRAALENRDFGANDFTVLRAAPMVGKWFNVGLTSQWHGFLVLDSIFLMDKVLTGPYWLASSKHGEKFRRFWGEVFEKYVNQSITKSCNDTEMKFFSNVCDSDGTQLCDGLILEGDSLIVLEYKSSMIRADAKYGGDPEQLTKELEKKFVGNDVGKPKGVRQIHNAAKKLLGLTQSNHPLGVHLSKVRKVYLLIVTLDSIGGAVGMSPFLNTYLDNSLLQDVVVAPIFCTNIRTLENVAGHFHSTSLVKLLNLWDEANPSHATPLAALDFPFEGKARMNLFDGVDDIFQQINGSLFPTDALESR